MFDSKKERLIIYLFVFLALAFPLKSKYVLKPARSKNAESLFNIIENSDAKNQKIAFVALDFGPNTIAENGAQAEVVIEHLMRKKVPMVLFSLYSLAEPFLESIPKKVANRLNAEYGKTVFKYGYDWLNLGFRPGAGTLIQQIPKSKDLRKTFEKDARGTPLSLLPIGERFRTIKDIGFLFEFTGLVGAFDNYVQFFQSGSYRPVFGHGCTSITIPEAFIYVDSGQLAGLLEGIAGAAWYSELLKDRYPKREVDSAAMVNTGLGVAHLVIILFILLGNAKMFFGSRVS